MPNAADGGHIPPGLDGRWPAPSGGGQGWRLRAGLTVPPVGASLALAAAATLARYALYAFSLVTQFCCVAYAVRQASTAVRMFVTVWLHLGLAARAVRGGHRLLVVLTGPGPAGSRSAGTGWTS